MNRRTHLLAFGLAALCVLVLLLIRSDPAPPERQTITSGGTSSQQELLPVGDRLEPSRSSTLIEATVRVHDSHLEPIEGALIAIGDAVSQPLLSTEATGIAQFPIEGVTTITVRHPSFPPETPTVSFENRVAHVVLTGAAEVQGTLRFPVDSSPIAGVHVLALPAGLAGTVSELITHPEVIVTDSDDSGRFRLQGLEPGRSYTFYAGGRGFVSVGRERAVAGGESRVEVVLDHALGALVSYQEPSGLPVRIPTTLSSSAKISCSARKGLVRTNPFDLASALSGVPIELASVPTATVLFYRAAELVESTVYLRGSLPGYEHLEEELQLSPVDDSGIRSSILYATPRTTSRGSVRIVLSSPTLETNGDGGTHPIGWVRFKSSDGEDLEFELRSTSTSLEELPAGTYQASLTLAARKTWEPIALGSRLVIGADPAEATWDLSSTGSVRFEPLDQNGSPYTGPLSLGIVRRLDGGVLSETEPLPPEVIRTSIDYHAPPYTARAVPAGTFSILLGGPQGPAVRNVTVRPGQDSLVRLQLRK